MIDSFKPEHWLVIGGFALISLGLWAGISSLGTSISSVMEKQNELLDNQSHFSFHVGAGGAAYVFDNQSGRLWEVGPSRAIELFNAESQEMADPEITASATRSVVYPIDSPLHKTQPPNPWDELIQGQK